MERPCGRIGVFRVLRTREGQSATEGPVEEASCVCCGEGISRDGVELNEETVDVLLKALLLEEVSTCRLWVCVACYKSLHSFLSIIRQLEELRVEFNDQRRRLGHHVALRSLKKSQESYDGWWAAVNSAEHVFPSEVRKRLKKTCSVAVGTDEVVKIEEEEEFFEMFACKMETETNELNEVDEPHKIGDLGGDNAAGPSDEHLRGRNVRLESTKSGVLAGCKETKDSQPTKRRSSASKVRAVRPNLSLSQVDTVESARGNGTTSDVKSEEGSPESHPSGLGKSTVDKTRVTLGGVSCDSLQTQTTVGRPRRATRKRVRYGESENADGNAGEEDSEFLPSVDEIVSDSEKSEDAESEEVGGTGHTGQQPVACKPLTMPQCARQPKKSPGRISNKHPRCKFCAKAFSGYHILLRHCYMDHKEDYLKDLPFACLVCYDVFSSAKTLEDHHKKTHESLKCLFCGKFSLGKRDFIEHMRTHTGEKPYACNACDRKFTLSRTLKVHLRTHTGEKPYACDVCNRKFSKNQHLKDHKNTHTGEKPYGCSCGQFFGWRSSMENHKSTTGHS